LPKLKKPLALASQARSLTVRPSHGHDEMVLISSPDDTKSGKQFMADNASQIASGDSERGLAQSLPVTEPENLEPLYANFVRLAGLSEELVLDFGLNPQPFGAPPIPVKVSQRMVMNYFTAKRLWLGLGAFLQRHEQSFGPIEIDVNKRIVHGTPPR
jgi:hypothetical protein